MQRPKVSEPGKPDESGLFLSAQGTRSHRYIPQHADRVLDAPDLPNDFYRNGLDWGSKNKVLCSHSPTNDAPFTTQNMVGSTNVCTNRVSLLYLLALTRMP